MAPLDCLFYVKPNTISDLTIWKNEVQIYPGGSSIESSGVEGEYLWFQYSGSGGTATLKATGYEDLEILLSEGSPEYYTMVSLPQPISNISDGTNTYVIKDTEARTALSSKQDTLVSGTNIKTINGESVLGSGDIATSSRNIGEIITSTIPLTDAGLHLLDGALIQGSGIYGDFVSYIADLYDDNPSANYFTTESDWQDSVTDYGVCAKFVYDSVNNTVRLPKITGFIEGAIDPAVLGDLVEAGLPNITGNTGIGGSVITSQTGAFYKTTNNFMWSNATATEPECISLDASRSSSIYGNSSTVQPQAIKAFYYIVIATSAKTEIEADIDEIATDLNGKADLDLANTSASLSNSFLAKLMPDYANGISGIATTWVRVTSDSFVMASGADPFTEDYFCQVSPDGGTTVYDVGRRYDDTNAQTQTTSFTFFVPRNWYFFCNAEGQKTYCIYPLKGAN